MTDIGEQFRRWINEEQFLCVSVVKSKNGRETYWGRILNFDIERGSLLFYNVDQKCTTLIMMNELEDIQPTGNNKPKEQTDTILSVSQKNNNIEQNIVTIDEVKEDTPNNAKNLKQYGDLPKEYKSVYEEVQAILCNLSSRELHAILPVLHLIDKIKKESN